MYNDVYAAKAVHDALTEDVNNALMSFIGTRQLDEQTLVEMQMAVDRLMKSEAVIEKLKPIEMNYPGLKVQITVHPQQDQVFVQVHAMLPGAPPSHVETLDRMCDAGEDRRLHLVMAVNTQSKMTETLICISTTVEGRRVLTPVAKMLGHYNPNERFVPLDEEGNPTTFDQAPTF